MNRLVLLRHGRTEGTERHLYYGATDLPLLEDGVQDLQLAAARGVYTFNHFAKSALILPVNE